MKKYFKYCEFLFFGLVNLFLSLGVFLMPFVFYFLPQDGETFDKNLVAYLFLFLLILLIYFFLKMFTLPFIYWLRILFPNMHKILFKIIKVKKIRHKFLMFCILYDVSIFLIWLWVNQLDFVPVFPYLLFGGGILPCYLVFLLVIKIFKPIGTLFKLKII